MNREVVAIDLAIAAVVAALVLIVTPGVAVSAIIALVALAAVGVNLAWGAWRRR